jgi:protein involved in polysaccharide export with SLBB domain
MNFSKSLFSLLLAFSLATSAQQSLDSVPDEILENIRQQTTNELNIDKNEIIVTQSLKKSENNLIKNVGSEIFGLNFFNFQAETKTPVLDIPLQSDYKISLNDELELLLTGTNNKLLNLRVDLGGSVLIQDLGRVSLQGMTISDANIKIQNLVDRTYISTNSFLNVKSPSLKKISVIGSVKDPGTFLVNPYISLSEAIKYAGGLNQNSSLRKILVKDMYGNITEHDMYDFLIFGDRKVDINLQNGDTVIISATSKLVNIGGEVQRPMIYEFDDNDRFGDLVEFSLGLTSSSSLENISVNKIQSEIIKTHKVNMADVIGKDNIIDLYIGKKELNKDKFLFVSGNGVDDGYFSYSKGQNLSEIIDMLKFSSDIYPFYSVLRQESENGRKIEFKYFSLFDKESLEGISLRNNPMLKFFSKEGILELGESLIESNLNNNENIDEDTKLFLNKSDLKLVTIGNRSIKLPLTANLTPNDIYNYLGIPGSLITKDVTINLANESVTDSLNTSFLASTLSGISFPEKENNTISVKITGQIANPGTYIVTTGTSLDDMYSIAGGPRKSFCIWYCL